MPSVSQPEPMVARFFRRHRDWMLWASVILFSIPLLLRCYIGTMTRMSSDDFCGKMFLSEHGFFGGQIYLYTKAYGRWASSLLLTIAPYAGSSLAPVLPAVSIMLCVVSIAWFSYKVSGKAVLSIVLAEAFVSAVMTAAPGAAVEPIYWQSALLTYIPPFIIAPVGAALAVRFNSTLIAGVSAFVACAFNEAVSIMFVCGLILAAMFVDNSRRRLILSALAGALLSTMIVAMSPGNALRRNNANPIPDLTFVLNSIIRTGQLLREVVLSPAGILLLVFGMALAPFVQIGNRIRPFWIAVTGILLALSATATSVYGVRTLMARTALVPAFPIAATLIFLGLWAGSRFVPRNAAILLVCATLFTAATVSKSLSLLPVMREYAQRWDARDKKLAAAAPGEQVLVDPVILPFRDAWDVEADPHWAINRCMATHYGVKSVQAK